MRTISKLRFNRINKIIKDGERISSVEVKPDDSIEDVFVCDTISISNYQSGDVPEYKSCYYCLYVGNEYKLVYRPSHSGSIYDDYLLDSEFEQLVNIDTNTTPNVCTINLITDAYCIKQNLIERMSNVRGDLPYNIELGVPLKFTRQSSRLIILNLINDTPGVTGCDVIKEYIANKKYVMDVQVHTQVGTFTITV